MKKENLSRDLHIAYTLLGFLTPARLRLLREHFGSSEAIASADHRLIGALLRVPEDRAKLVKNPLQVPEISRTVTRNRERTVAIDDPEYPELLRQIPDPPSALYCEGNRALLSRDSIAIVGSRRSSRYGLAVAEKLGRELSSLGITVVSGLARGIDQAAHRGALAEEGSTIAVLGTGIDVDYPRGSRTLRERIVSQGLMLTELPPGSPPRPSSFPVRNRIISGLSLGVVIVEATDRSGSLITARLAAEQNREVFAVPGSVFYAGSTGPHRLIQYGAKLVHDLEDVLEELQIHVNRQTRLPGNQKSYSGLSARIVDRLTHDVPTHVDVLAADLAVAIGPLSVSLLELEVDGTIRSVPGGGWLLDPLRA